MKHLAAGMLTVSLAVGMLRQSAFNPPHGIAVQGQETTLGNPTPTKPAGKLKPVAPPEYAQAKDVLALTQRVQDLERLVNELSLREKQWALADAHTRLTLVQSESELARFDCTEEWNRAAATALEQREPLSAYQGAGAMNCTQRLSKIVHEVVEALDKNQ